jgi:hypothetical protein
MPKVAQSCPKGRPEINLIPMLFQTQPRDVFKYPPVPLHPYGPKDGQQYTIPESFILLASSAAIEPNT